MDFSVYFLHYKDLLNFISQMEVISLSGCHISRFHIQCFIGFMWKELDFHIYEGLQGFLVQTQSFKGILLSVKCGE